jgi:hypothetical protein
MADGDDIPVVNPQIKLAEIDDDIREIIQDEGPNYQVGGDDRLGVAINMNIALNTGMDLALLFTTDEEVGLISAEYVKFPELLDFDLLVQVDRGNHSNQLVTRIGCTQLCSDETSSRLLRIADDIGLPRTSVNGMLTDVLAIKNNKMCRNAVNMTCGYHNSFGSSKGEFIDIQEAKDTMRFVNSIVKDYYLEGSTEIRNEKGSEDEDFGFSIAFTEEEISEMEKIYSPEPNSSFGKVKRSRKYYDEDNLFSEELYAEDRKDDLESEWDSWRGFCPIFER